MNHGKEYYKDLMTEPLLPVCFTDLPPRGDPFTSKHMGKVHFLPIWRNEIPGEVKDDRGMEMSLVIRK